MTLKTILKNMNKLSILLIIVLCLGVLSAIIDGAFIQPTETVNVSSNITNSINTNTQSYLKNKYEN